MSSKIKSIIETLAKDETNPGVNKNAIVELGKETDAIPNVESAVDGTIDKALGLDATGKLVKGTASGGSKLYRHDIVISDYDSNFYEFGVISSSSTSVVGNKQGFIDLIRNSIKCYKDDGDNTYCLMLYMDPLGESLSFISYGGNNVNTIQIYWLTNEYVRTDNITEL